MATIKDVARLANVSGATVSHVLNKTRKVNPETIERVNQAIKKLGYRPNAQARGLKTGASFLIGVISISSIDPFFSEVMYGIERTAVNNGYGVILCHSEFNKKFQMDNFNIMLNNNIDGLIINSPILSDNFYEFIRQFKQPCVLLQFFDESLQTDYIHTDDFTAAYDATRYLIGLNHHQIACIGGYTYPQDMAFQRKLGYEKALSDSGIPIDTNYYSTSDFSIDDGYQVFKKFISLAEPPTAIITYSDLLALGAMRAAVDMGLSIPGDISIIGYDDIQLSSFSIPRLTTVFQEKNKLGQLAFERILNRINNPDLPYERQVLQSQLIIRESCGPAPA